MSFHLVIRCEGNRTWGENPLNPRESRKLQDDEEMYIDSFSIVSDRCSLQKRGGLRGRTQAQGAAFDAEYAGAA